MPRTFNYEEIVGYLAWWFNTAYGEPREYADGDVVYTADARSN